MARRQHSTAASLLPVATLLSRAAQELTPTSGLGLSCTLDLRQYYTVRRLGAGGWGWVEQGVLLLPCGSTLHMAVKNLRLRKGAEHLHKVAMRELEGMLALQGCPYGVQLYGTTFDFQTEERGQPLQRFQLFMELAEKGTLKDELVGGGGVRGCRRGDGSAIALRAHCSRTRARPQRLAWTLVLCFWSCGQLPTMLCGPLQVPV